MARGRKQPESASPPPRQEDPANQPGQRFRSPAQAQPDALPGRMTQDEQQQEQPQPEIEQRSGGGPTESPRGHGMTHHLDTGDEGPDIRANVDRGRDDDPDRTEC